jgi:4'-phosphopantetheinyl transferase
MVMILPPNEIHVWRARSDEDPQQYGRLADTLSADERARAERFHFERDRHRYIVSHGMLRVILSRYLHVGPGQLRFGYGPQGKPYLAADMGHPGLQFNMAHSHEIALYAVVSEHAVGIDVELIRDLSDLENIAASFFSPSENAALRSLSAEQRVEGFYNCWTRKEAYVKAIGEGLACSLDQFDVSLAPGEQARLLSVAGDTSAASQWSLWTLRPAPGYVGAIAVSLPSARQPHYRLRLLDPPGPKPAQSPTLAG